MFKNVNCHFAQGVGGRGGGVERGRRLSQAGVNTSLSILKYFR